MSSGHGSRRKKHEEHEEHENHERWLVSYADMVTLLMVLFVVMFAMSQVDEKKYAQLKEGLAAGFGSSDSLLVGSSSLHDQPGSAPVDSVSPQLATANLDSEQRQVVANAVQQAAALQNQRSWDEAAAEAERLEKVRATLTEALEREGLAGDVATSYADPSKARPPVPSPSCAVSRSSTGSRPPGSRWPATARPDHWSTPASPARRRSTSGSTSSC